MKDIDSPFRERLFRRSSVDGEDSRPGGIPQDKRRATEHDHDRVLYSGSFRRLGGVTQTSIGSVTAGLHNRLTHSLRVEHMGAVIGKTLRREYEGLQLDIPAIRAACLAHDLGHPPFGHIGEKELDRLVRCESHRRTPSRPYQRISGFGGSSYSEVIRCEGCLLPDGFEGNAQSFRIVSLLESHSTRPGYGLDLTALSLAAVSKYPWLLGGNKDYPGKWGAFDCDRGVLEVASPNGKDVHAEVMDWADDIAYSVHDIEDYFRNRMIPLHEYAQSTQTAIQFWSYVTDKFARQGKGDILELGREAVEEVFALFPKTEFRGSSDDFHAIDGLRSGLITQFIGHMEIDASGRLQIDPVVSATNALLKELTWFHVIDNPELMLAQRGQQLVVSQIVSRLRDIIIPSIDDFHSMLHEDPNSQRAELRRIPSRLRRYLWLGWTFNQYEMKQSAHRAIIDYVASLTDHEAYYLDGLLAGRPEHHAVGSPLLIG